MIEMRKSVAISLTIACLVVWGARAEAQPLPAGWINASVAANGCSAVAVAEPDNRPALQCMIDHLYGTRGAGRILLPAGWLRVCGTVVLKGAITLQGVGKEGTQLASCGDHTVVHMDTSVRYGGFRDIFVVGYQNPAASTEAVFVAANVPAIMRDCNIWGGGWALRTHGIDGVVDNCYIMGDNPSMGGIWSEGANWYRRVKLDTGSPRNVAFAQGGSITGGVMENTFDQSDFSGPFSHSIYIAHSTAWTVCNSCVVSGPVTIVFSQLTSFAAGSHFGANIWNNGGPLLIAASAGMGPVWVTGPGPRSCGVTHNITC